MYNQSIDIHNEGDEILEIDQVPVPGTPTAVQGTAQLFLAKKSNGDPVLCKINNTTTPPAQLLITMRDINTGVPYSVTTNFWGWRP